MRREGGGGGPRGSRLAAQASGRSHATPAARPRLGPRGTGEAPSGPRGKPQGGGAAGGRPGPFRLGRGLEPGPTPGPGGCRPFRPFPGAPSTPVRVPSPATPAARRGPLLPRGPGAHAFPPGEEAAAPLRTVPSLERAASGPRASASPRPRAGGPPEPELTAALPSRPSSRARCAPRGPVFGSGTGRGLAERPRGAAGWVRTAPSSGEPGEPEAGGPGGGRRAQGRVASRRRVRGRGAPGWRPSRPRLSTSAQAPPARGRAGPVHLPTPPGLGFEPGLQPHPSQSPHLFLSSRSFPTPLSLSPPPLQLP